MIKPDAMPRIGAMLTVIGEHFSIAEMRLLRLTKKEAELFYEEHKERTFFGWVWDKTKNFHWCFLCFWYIYVSYSL